MIVAATVRLADPDARLPLPGMAGVFAPAGPFQVNPLDPFWGQCLADGTVIAVDASAPPARPAKAAADK